MRGQWKLCLLFGVLLGTVQCQDDDAPMDDDPPPEFDEPGGADPSEYPPGDGPMTSAQLHSLHQKMDGNKDGKVSMEEFVGFSEAIAKVSALKSSVESLEHMDEDKDGKVSLKEIHGDFSMWKDMEDKERAEREIELEKAKFKTADKDGDGLLDKDELPTIMHPELHPELLKQSTETLMKTKDKDGNGELSKKEFFAPETPASVEGEEQPPMEENEDDGSFESLDKDSSGSVTLEELKRWVSGHVWVEKAMRQLMSSADKDGDNHVTFAELDEAKEAVAGTDAHFHLMDWHEHHGEL